MPSLFRLLFVLAFVERGRLRRPLRARDPIRTRAADDQQARLGRQNPAVTAMMHDERFRRKSAAGAATALSLLLLADRGARCASGHCAGRAIRQSLRHSRTTEPRRRGKADDAYSPPPDKRSYLPPSEHRPPIRMLRRPWRREAARRPGSLHPRATTVVEGPAQRFAAECGHARRHSGRPSRKATLRPSCRATARGCRTNFGAGWTSPALEKLIASIEIPPRSPALHDLWKRAHHVAGR